MGNFEDLEQSFRKYASYYLVENEHLMKPMIHAYISAVFKPQLYYKGSKVMARTSSFFFQPSGTGKSQAMKCVYWGVKNLSSELKVEKITTLTDAALIGSIVEGKKNEIKPLYGILYDTDFAYFDEADFIARQTQWTESIFEILQNALDEDGYVSRHLRLGTLAYKTPTTILGGSYMTDSLNTGILRKGLFQRCLVSYKSFTDDEKRKMFEKLQILETKKGYERDDEFAKNLKPVVEQILKKQKGSNPLVINVQDLARFSKDVLMPYWDDRIFDQYIGDRQEIIETFAQRQREKIMHLACHKAYLEGDISVSFDDLMYGFETSRISISSIKTILDMFSKPRDDEKSEEYMGKILVNMIEEGVNYQSAMIQRFNKMRITRTWKLSKSKTYELLVNDKFLEKFSIARTQEYDREKGTTVTRYKIEV